MVDRGYLNLHCFLENGCKWFSTLNKGLLEILVCFDKLHEMRLAALSCTELHEYLWELFLVVLILQ